MKQRSNNKNEAKKILSENFTRSNKERSILLSKPNSTKLFRILGAPILFAPTICTKIKYQTCLNISCKKIIMKFLPDFAVKIEWIAKRLV